MTALNVKVQGGRPSTEGNDSRAHSAHIQYDSMAVSVIWLLHNSITSTIHYFTVRSDNLFGLFVYLIIYSPLPTPNSSAIGLGLDCCQAKHKHFPNFLLCVGQHETAGQLFCVMHMYLYVSMYCATL